MPTQIFKEMTQLHEEILKNADIADEDFADIWEDMVHSAIKYSDTRAKWNYMTNEQKLDKDAARTIEHNIVIDNFIVLERVFKLSGWKNNS